MFDFRYYSTESKYYNDSNKLVVGKNERWNIGVVIKKLAGLKPKMYSFLLEYSNEHKKEKGVIKMLLQQ